MNLLDNEIVRYAVTTVIAGLMAIIIQRTSKTHAERYAEILEKLAKVADMNADQLLAKLALIDKMDAKIKDLEVLSRSESEARILRDRRITELERIEQDTKDKYEKLKAYTEKLIRTLEERGIPLPEMNGGLPDSIRGWKWHKK